MKNKAFTAVEMFMVIVIIAILMGIFIPKFKGMQDDVKIAQAKSEINTLQAAVESYKNNNSGVLPTKLDELLSAHPKIVTSIVSDPFQTSGSWYSYQMGGSKYYVIFSVGPDRVPATSINGSGVVTTSGDDICVTNGKL